MANYLKKFELTTQYEEYINSDSVLLPNVSLIKNNNTVYYNPVHIPNYLTFTAEEDNSAISLDSESMGGVILSYEEEQQSLSSEGSPNIKYSLNGGEWIQWDYSPISLNRGNTVRMKGNNSNGFNYNNESYNYFKMTGKISASGNIMSLLYEDDFEGKLTIPCEYCFYCIFKNCTVLTTAPELPATTLAAFCYTQMFENCASLTTAPELPATTLTEACYQYMFHECTSLTTAPELPAKTLTNYCYDAMFWNCTKLNYIKMLATDISAYNCLQNWMKYVASTGTFIKHPNMTSLRTESDSGIPRGWTVQNVTVENGTDEDVDLNYLTFTAEEDNSTISLNAATESENPTINPDIKYSLNGGAWAQWDRSAITLNTGDTVRMKGNNSNGFNIMSYNGWLDEYIYFQMTGKIGASGNIMSLLYGDDFEGKLTIPCEYCFNGLFQNCTSLTTAPELPATTLEWSCYNSMFQDCNSLITAPELPATTLASACYEYMFSGCTSLTTAPVLPATTIAGQCYYRMFYGCTSLTVAPELPATTLFDRCYSNMFEGCTSLTTAPELPATTLATKCYYQMFSCCTSLTTAPELPATTLATDCYYRMFEGCTSLTNTSELPPESIGEPDDIL